MAKTTRTKRPARTGSGTGSGANVIDAKHEAFRKYRIIAADDREFIQTAGELLEGSQLLSNRALATANLIAVMKRIVHWCRHNRKSLQAALMSYRADKLTLFFVPSSPRYDLDLDARMTDLEVDLGGSSGLGAVESFQIPARSIEQFVGEDAILLWNGESDAHA